MVGFNSTTDDEQMFLRDVAHAACKHLPQGYELQLCMENGAATVDLYSDGGEKCLLPDSADKSLEEQINDALCVANGFDA